MGRPSLYETEWRDKLHVIEGWARDGLTDAQIADNMGIAAGTLYEYKKRYPEFASVLKKGKEVVDFHVENALLKRALGYEYEETEAIVTDAGSESGTKRIKRVKKHMAPDVTAQIFWLKNRKPNEWREKKTTEHTGEVEIEVTLEGDEE